MRLWALLLCSAAIAGSVLVARADDSKRIIGRVYDVQAGVAILDVGREAGVQSRLVFDVYQQARVIKLPMTAETAYIPERKVAQLVVVDVDNKTSRAKILAAVAGQPAPVLDKAAFADAFVVSNPYAVAPNTPPDIKSLTASPSARVAFGQPVLFKAEWSDEKDDIVYFDWSCTGGVLSHERSSVPEVVWTPPVAKGAYKLTCTAVDTGGNKTPKTVDVEATGLGAQLKNVYEVRRFRADQKSLFGKCRDLSFDEQNAAVIVDSDRGRLVQVSGDWETLMQTDDSTIKLEVDRIVVRGGEVFATDMYAKRGVKLRLGQKAYQEQPAVVYGQEGLGNGQFETPADIDVSPKGLVFILNSSEKRPCVHVYSLEGQFVASLGALGTTEGLFGKPVALSCAHDGTLYVLDDFRKKVLVYKNLRLAFEFDAGGQTDQLLDMKVDPLTGRVCVLEGVSGQVRSFNAAGQPIDSAFGAQGEQVVMGVFNRPKRLRFDQAGGLYVLASDGKVIHRVDPAIGQEVARWGGIDFSSARGIAAAPGGDLAVVLKSSVVSIDARGWTKAIIGGAKGGVTFQSPVAVACGSAGEIVVVDEDACVLDVFDSRGTLLRAIGKKGEDSTDFSDPVQITTDIGRRNVAVLEKRKQWNVKVYDLDGHLRAAFPGGKKVLADANHLAMTERYVHVALESGNVKTYDCTAALAAKSPTVDGDGLNGFWKDDWTMKDIDEPSGLQVSNLALFFAVNPKSFVQVLDLTKSGNFVTQIKDPKCPKPLMVAVDDYDRVYVWDGDAGRVVQFGR